MSENTSESVIACVVGTRPELIKMAPVIRALRHSCASVSCIHSGQHDSLAATAFSDMDLQPDVCVLPVKRNSDPGLLFTSLCDSLRQVFAHIKPRAVVVHGDTGTAWAACMAAFYLRIPVGHVEAGLRCPTLEEPFPEEAHRRLIARLAHWHFAPTPKAAAALKRENVQGDILVCGNTAIDSILAMQRKWSSHPHQPCSELMSAWQRSYNGNALPFRLLITLHRRENRGTALRAFMLELDQWMSQSRDNFAIWPLHANPELQAEIHLYAKTSIREENRLRLIFLPALGYADTLWALQHCSALATDSGGLQEEASAFFKPVLILRNSTERPEALEAGYAHLTGCGQGRLHAAISSVQAGLWPLKPAPDSPKRWPFGDGHAARRIAEHLIKTLSVTPTQPIP